MKFQKFLLIWTFCFAGILQNIHADTITNSEGSQLELYGIGLAQELRNDIYIGALYVPSGYTDWDLILDKDTPKRITVRYLANNYSYRKVSRHWKERIAMNNDREVWQPLTREIVTFSNAIKENVISGDELILDYIPGKGTVLFLNELQTETIQNPDFFRLFITSWTGSVPPTKAFKQGILGELPKPEINALESQFASLTPIKGRFSKTSTQVAAVKPEIPKPSVSTPNITPVTKIPEKKVVEKPTAPEKKPEPKPVEVKKEIASQEKPTPVVEKPSQQVKEQVASLPSFAEKPTVQSEVKPVLVEDFVDEDLIRGSFVRELIAEINKNQTYPRKALINREQGDGMAHVIIDRSGEIIEVTITDKTGSRELDRAVIKMIRQTSPFPPVPKELPEKQFEFDVPVSFRL